MLSRSIEDYISPSTPLVEHQKRLPADRTAFGSQDGLRHRNDKAFSCRRLATYTLLRGSLGRGEAVALGLIRRHRLIELSQPHLGPAWASSQR
jgi:hypothetical protein